MGYRNMIYSLILAVYVVSGGTTMVSLVRADRSLVCLRRGSLLRVAIFRVMMMVFYNSEKESYLSEIQQ